MNGMAAKSDIGFRPNLSIRGPIISDPIGSEIVTKLAKN